MGTEIDKWNITNLEYNMRVGSTRDSAKRTTTLADVLDPDFADHKIHYDVIKLIYFRVTGPLWGESIGHKGPVTETLMFCLMLV